MWTPDERQKILEDFKKNKIFWIIRDLFPDKEEKELFILHCKLKDIYALGMEDDYYSKLLYCVNCKRKPIDKREIIACLLCKRPFIIAE